MHEPNPNHRDLAERTTSDCCGSADHPTGRTKQSFSEDADINNVMARWIKTGDMPKQGRPTYGDFSNVDEYQTMLNRIIDAEESFMELSPKIRDRMHNDPANLIKFISNPDNREEALKLGLIQAIVPEPDPEPIVVRMAPEEPPATP